MCLTYRRYLAVSMAKKLRLELWTEILDARYAVDGGPIQLRSSMEVVYFTLFYYKLVWFWIHPFSGVAFQPEQTNHFSLFWLDGLLFDMRYFRYIQIQKPWKEHVMSQDEGKALSARHVALLSRGLQDIAICWFSDVSTFFVVWMRGHVTKSASILVVSARNPSSMTWKTNRNPQVWQFCCKGERQKSGPYV